ncbi:hypothetical protein KIN34_02175 [Cellulomonas sp. DKR-3]|uniref:Polysaccharide pyruvyl transferase domain-containing protein n=1 Tax=Cellulomonas fulva TaxID=2835530 RepID=A0ABS5TVE3_9CELL|nr:polysaccharide pyruvyl transferase family protein [Cellulomonas fulva]MBT0993100.1 hypothetical protein [Cellulomonas fulva]
MSIDLYWWRPTRSARALAGELVRRGGAWARMLAQQTPRMTNFGDEFSAIALGELTGARVRWAAASRARVYGIGSILTVYARERSEARVFGSGLRGAPATPWTVPAERVLAVRGTLTRDALGLPDDTVLGDPGLVVGSLDLGVGPRVRRPLVLPHFGAVGSAPARSALASMRAGGYDVVLPNAAPLEVARRIAAAPFLATSSLHGLVFAHALGTPARLVTFPGVPHQEPLFKYDDYLSALGDRARFVDVAQVPDDRAAARTAESLGEHAVVLRARAAAVAEALAPVARRL